MINSKPRWARRKIARPAELTAAALELFVEHGYAATRLEDVAVRAGVSKGTLYLYFDSKEALFKAVVRQGLVSILERGERMFGEHRGSATALLTELLWAWWDSIGRQPISGLCKLMVSECRNFPELGRFYYDEVIGRGYRLIAAAIRRGVDSGEFRAVDADLAARLVCAPQMLLTIWHHSFRNCERDAVNAEVYIRQHLQILFAGLSAKSGPEFVSARTEHMALA